MNFFPILRLLQRLPHLVYSALNPSVGLRPLYICEMLCKLECALCGDANPRRLKWKSCSGWHHTMSQPLHEVSQKYHFTVSFDTALWTWGWILYKEYYILWQLAAFRHSFRSAGNNRPHCISAQNLNIVASSVPQTWIAKNLWSFELKINRRW